MLTVKQPPTYGYKSVHDLPTPPSTSRPSPPLIYQEPATKSLPVAHRSHSPPSQPMSAPHRGLPPPAAMTLPPQQPPAGVAPLPAHHAPPLPTHHAPPPPPPPPPPALAPPSHQQRDSWGQLPAPPQQWQGAEESMKHWLQARAEEDKRRQEEERTRQESLRLEQRKVEMDMLRTSLSGGIPPPMVPLVFTGMASGGIMPQAALEWAQQFMPPSQVPRAQIMPAGWPVSPEHQRESQAHAQHHGLPPAPTPSATGYAYPGSPTRQRGQTVSGAIGRPMGALPSLNTNVPQPTHGPPPGMHSHPHMHQAQQQQQQHESQSSPSIYFHHWQPPTSQASGGSNRPGSPSGETPRKRKATGQHQPAPSPTRIEQRLRSPPPFSQSSFVNPPPPGGRRGHTRQRSDMSPFRTAGLGRSRRESFGGPLRRMSPIRSSPGPSQDRVGSERSESQKQSVSSLLSEEPRPLSQHSGIPRPGEEVEHGHQQASPVETKPQTGAEETLRREGTGEGEGAQG